MRGQRRIFKKDRSGRATEGRHEMKPPAVPQQVLSPAASERRKTMTQSPNAYPGGPLPSQSDQPPPLASTSYRPLSPPSLATSATSIPLSGTTEPALTSSINATILAASTSQGQHPTFSVASPLSSTHEAKLKKLKDKLQAEISEVDNLTEEKKRLDERIKELEAMVDEEREKSREVEGMNMKERIQFLSVMEKVVELGWREGDEAAGFIVKRQAGNGGDRGGSAGSGVGDEVLRGEVEGLREGNRVCEAALEHIQREARHMEDTTEKLIEARRGIQLVLGRAVVPKANVSASAVLVAE